MRYKNLLILLLLISFNVFGFTPRLFYQDIAKTNIYTENASATLNLYNLNLDNSFIFDSQTITGIATGTALNSKLATEGHVADAVAAGGGGGGIGSPDTFALVDGEEPNDNITDWLNPDSLLTLNSTTPLNGDNDFLITNITGSASKTVCGPIKDVPEGSRGRRLSVYQKYFWDGDDTDMFVELYDVTNTATLSGSKIYFTASEAGRILPTSFTQSTTAQIRPCYTINIENNGKNLRVDDLEYQSDALETRQIYASTEWYDCTDDIILTSVGTVSNKSIDCRRDGDDLLMKGGFTTGTTAPTQMKIGLPTGLNLDPAKAPYNSTLNRLGWGQKINGANPWSSAGYTSILLYNGTDTDSVSVSTESTNDTTIAFLNASAYLATGDSFLFGDVRIPIEGWTNTAEGVVQSNTLPVNVYRGKIQTTNVITGWNEDVIDTVTDNGTTITVVFETGIFTVAPHVMIIAYDSVSSLAQVQNLEVTASGFSYNIVDYLGNNQGGADEPMNVTITKSLPDYKQLNQTIITPVTQTCYIKDVKSNGTEGGTATSGAWQTRTLNTLEGDCGWVDLDSNQFTITGDKIILEAYTPAFVVNNHTGKLRNITTSTDESIGSAAQSSSSNFITTNSKIYAILENISGISFEIQHRVETTRSTDGFGLASNFGVDEVYTQVKLTRLK